MLKACAFLATLACVPLSGAQTPARPASIATLQRDIPAFMQQGDIPGLSIAVIRDGRTAWIGSLGEANKETHQPVTQRTIFNVGSLSKTVFAYTVLKLVDQGKLDLDTPLTHYVPDRVTDDARLDQITARFVLSHRTGFPNWRADKHGKLPIYFTPGERFSYSGEGMVYLQHVVETITGKPLNDVVDELVFQPLGMTESSYVTKPNLLSDASTAYTSSGKAIPLFQEKGANAAASLNTNAHDYALFLEAVLSGRGLKPSTLRQMETPQIAVDPTCTNCLEHAPKTLSTELFWGLGWGIEKNATGTYLWHWGDNGVYKAYVVADIHRRAAVVMIANSEDGLSIAKPVVEEAIGGTHPSFAWLQYQTYDSADFRFSKHALVHGPDQAMRDFATDIANGKISESTINSLGYSSLGQKDYPEAIVIFKRNVELHPASSNTYDSLGEAYMDAGEIQLAIKNYKKALELDPGSANAKAMLDKLNAPVVPAP